MKAQDLVELISKLRGCQSSLATGMSKMREDTLMVMVSSDQIDVLIDILGETIGTFTVLFPDVEISGRVSSTNSVSIILNRE